MPPERVLRFLLYIEASFRGLSPAPSHHLGVDVFVGTFGSPDVVATSGLAQPMRTSSRSVVTSLRADRRSRTVRARRRLALARA